MSTSDAKTETRDAATDALNRAQALADPFVHNMRAAIADVFRDAIVKIGEAGLQVQEQLLDTIRVAGAEPADFPSRETDGFDTKDCFTFYSKECGGPLEGLCAHEFVAHVEQHACEEATRTTLVTNLGRVGTITHLPPFVLLDHASRRLRRSGDYTEPISLELIGRPLNASLERRLLPLLVPPMSDEGFVRQAHQLIRAVRPKISEEYGILRAKQELEATLKKMQTTAAAIEKERELVAAERQMLDDECKAEVADVARHRAHLTAIQNQADRVVTQLRTSLGTQLSSSLDDALDGLLQSMLYRSEEPEEP